MNVVGKTLRKGQELAHIHTYILFTNLVSFDSKLFEASRKQIDFFFWENNLLFCEVYKNDLIQTCFLHYDLIYRLVNEKKVSTKKLCDMEKLLNNSNNQLKLEKEKLSKIEKDLKGQLERTEMKLQCE